MLIQWRKWLPPLFLFLIPFIFPGFAYFSADTVGTSDLNYFFLPLQKVLYTNLHEGVVPLWNPYCFAGLPAMATGQMATFYPLNTIPVFIFGPSLGLKIRLLLHLALSGVGMYYLLREMKISPLVAVLVALNYQLAGHTMTKTFFIPVGDSAAWVPWLFLIYLRFARRPTLGRALLCGVTGGVMYLLFLPYIVIPASLFTVCLGVAVHIKIGSFGNAPTRLAWILERFFIPFLLFVLFLLMVRYPDSGWQSAFTGLGREGLFVFWLFLAAGCLWVVVRRIRVRVNWSKIWRWAAGFAGAWILSAMLAGPQLGPTAQMIPHSNQIDLAPSAEEYFTGRDAYGSFQHFIALVTLCKNKEMVNNIALGPGIVLLVFGGLLMGLQRRRKVYLWVLIGALFIASVYFVVPGVLRVVPHTPIFSKFKGFSRYLVFLNLFIFILVGLTVQMAPRQVPSGLRKPVRGCFILLLIVNLPFLIVHDVGFLSKIVQAEADRIPLPVIERLEATLPEGRLYILDHPGVPEKGRAWFSDGMLYGLRSIPTHEAMRLRGYDKFIHAHNASLGVNHDDYHAPLIEPVATAWTRALGARMFVFPENRSVPAIWSGLGVESIGFEKWRILDDPSAYPPIWPESDIGSPMPSPDIPDGYQVSRWKYGLHRIEVAVEGVEPDSTLVLGEPYYNGWKAWVNGEPVEMQMAHDFLRVIPVNSESAHIVMEYRPLGLVLGWAACLAGMAIVIALWSALRLDLVKHGIAVVLLVLICATIGVVAGSLNFFTLPDQVRYYIFELLFVIVLSFIAAKLISRSVKKSV